MKEFPQLIDPQVALLRADAKTGHVLDKDLHLVSNDEQDVYTMFDNSNMALSYAKSIVSTKGFVECVIYNANKTVLHYVSPLNLHTFK